MKKLVILDRDGVINRDSEHYIKTPEEWEALPGSLEAIAELTRAGYSVVVATNQAGIGKKLFDMHALNAIHQKMLRAVTLAGGHIEAIFFCPHHPDDHCACRKPKIGLLTDIAARYELESPAHAPSSIPSAPCVPFVGDSLRDVQAAVAAGCVPHLVLTGNGQKTLDKHADALPSTLQIHRDLKAFSESFCESFS